MAQKVLITVFILIIAGLWLVNVYHIVAGIPGVLKYVNIVLLPVVAVTLLWSWKKFK